MMDPFKQALRQTIKSVRSNLSLAYQQKASTQVCAKIKKLHAYRYAKRIALYHPVEKEIDLNDLWRSAPLQGKFCYFPSLNQDKTLSFLPATPATPFRNNRYGIPEPDVDVALAIPVKNLDVIFMPLLAFDDWGTRLGMGAGYYDRTLAKEPTPLLMGVAYEFQRQAYIQPQTWDISMNLVITPQTIYPCSSKGF